MPRGTFFRPGAMPAGKRPRSRESAGSTPRDANSGSEAAFKVVNMLAEGVGVRAIERLTGLKSEERHVLVKILWIIGCA
ncbi:hypothetical protein SBV1_1390006 [Verrucomicrobia bacterium]|nr:hypothetical protein SBV1_1390006 [Verrucomicrobiota bacterium]